MSEPLLSQPFRLRYFASLAAQKKRFFRSPELAKVSAHPTLKKLLDDLPNTILHGDTTQRAHVFRPAIKPALPILIEILMLHIINAFCVLVNVWIGSKYLEGGVTLEPALLVAGLTIILEFIRERVFYNQLFLQGNLARVVQLSLFSRVNEKLHTIDPGAGDEFSKGNLKVLIGSDIDNVEDFINAVAWIWFPAISMLLILSPFVIIKLGTVGAIGLAACSLQIVISAVFGYFLEKLQNKKQAQEDILTTKIGEWVRNIRLTRFLGMQDYLRRDVQAAVRTMTAWGLLKHVISSFSYALSTSLWLIIVFVMLVAAAWLHAPIVLTTFFPSLWALTYIANYFEHVPYTLMLYGPALSGAKRVRKLLLANELEDMLVKGGAVALTGTPTHIVFENVGLAIKGVTILSDLSFELALSERTAVIGSVGSGKSLLLSLIIGERAPSSGTIKIKYASGELLPFWHEPVYRQLRSLFAVSEQSPFLSSATLRENIDLSDSRSLSQIEQTVREAEMESDVAMFPEGLEEEVGEVGVNLSGGQKQRVSLARAFITNRQYFVLDDPLSAVDSTTEKKLFSTIIGKGSGCLLVSHRLHELAACDRLIVLENGTIVEDGVPMSLQQDPQSYFSSFIRREAISE